MASKASPACPVSVTRFANTDDKAFPASLPLIPLLARIPSNAPDFYIGIFNILKEPPATILASNNCCID